MCKQTNVLMNQSLLNNQQVVLFRRVSCDRVEHQFQRRSKINTRAANCNNNKNEWMRCKTKMEKQFCTSIWRWFTVLWLIECMKIIDCIDHSIVCGFFRAVLTLHLTFQFAYQFSLFFSRSKMTVSFEEPTPVQKYYKGKTIFITGGSGFMGKVSSIV